MMPWGDAPSSMVVKDALAEGLLQAESAQF
jgi:hypothetical protein